MATSVGGREAGAAPAGLVIRSPAKGETTRDFLTAVLRWQYPLSHDLIPWWTVCLEVSREADLARPFIKCDLRDDQTEYRFVALPDTTYHWRITPIDNSGGSRVERTEAAATSWFTTGKPLNRVGAADAERYRNPRRGAHWIHMPAVPRAEDEPLSPWYKVKAYRQTPPPAFAHIRERLPAPVWDDHPEALEVYGYCWDTLLRVWTYAPLTDEHQAVSNLIGYPAWGPWGSTMIFDTCFILHFARYGHQAYPFITGLDNVYARQHENGYICRESDKDNREVSSGYPVNPPLLSWAEWEQYQITADKQRLEAVFLPLVKHYEWWMTYQRRENGLYWTHGLQEADDSPRNALMHAAVSATSYQGLASQCLARIAAALGREDMRDFFQTQNEELRQLVNQHFWDESHRIYNDLDQQGRPITELQPGALCKHVHMFWPLMAGFATPERADAMVAELRNPASFNRLTGVPSLSADSAGYNTENGQYWRGAVWPPTQCMVQEGLKQTGHREELQELAARYHRACVADYQQQRTLRENMAPDRVLGCGQPDFVGWSGIGPVANLIEYVLGFEIDAPHRTISWTVRQPERHGLTNLHFCGFQVDLVAEPAAADKPRRITVSSGGEFTLRVRHGPQLTEQQIGAEKRTIVIE
jgi:hypothetical protein